jgi:ABC-type transport system substrate-binding protein
MKSVHRRWGALGLVLTAAFLAVANARAETVLRVVMNTDLKIVDPIWTTVYVTRNHGYMVYDTLFALDEKHEPKPQMVDSFLVSGDGLTYTFVLRDGLLWHDGTPVTAEDCVASLKRWGRQGLDGPEAHEPVGQLERARSQDLRFEAEGEDRPCPCRPRQTLGKPALHDAQACGGNRSQ